MVPFCPREMYQKFQATGKSMGQLMEGESDFSSHMSKMEKMMAGSLTLIQNHQSKEAANDIIEIHMNENFD